MCTTQLLFSSLDGATISRSCGRKIAKSKKKSAQKFVRISHLHFEQIAENFQKIPLQYFTARNVNVHLY